MSGSSHKSERGGGSKPAPAAKAGRFYDKACSGLYEATGGAEAFKRISERFHSRIDQDPRLRRLFPGDMGRLEERLALFLSERTGGPAAYTATRGKTSLFCRHAHIAIGPDEAKRWLGHMSASLEEEGVDEAVRQRMMDNLAALASTLVDPLIEYYFMPLAALRRRLEADPAPARASARHWSLLSAAAMRWDIQRVKLLLEFGARVNDTGAEHNALYRAANGGGANQDAGAAVIKLLLEHGGDVNQVSGVGGMTPLHMSARRGTVRIAEVLLDTGADIEAKDKSGETPLRRAVNCRQEAMVRFLISRGANPTSTDRHGCTPVDAARTENVRNMLLAGR